METITAIYIGTLIMMGIGAVLKIFDKNEKSENKNYKKNIIYRKRFKQFHSH